MKGILNGKKVLCVCAADPCYRMLGTVIDQHPLNVCPNVIVQYKRTPGLHNSTYDVAAPSETCWAHTLTDLVVLK